MNQQLTKMLKQKKYLLFSICLFILLGLLGKSFPALAQSPAPAPTTNPLIQEKVEDRLQKVLNEKTSKKRAFFGEIRNLNSTIEIKTNSETKHLLPSETDLVVIGAKKENLEIGNLEIGSFVIAMGYLTEEGALDTRRIVVSEKPKEETRRVIFGKISDITNDGENILTVTSTEENENEEIIFEVETDSKTTITTKNAGETENIEFSDLETGQSLVIIGIANAKNDKLITATTIHVVSATAPTGKQTTDNSTASPNPSKSTATTTTKKLSPAPTLSE